MAYKISSFEEYQSEYSKSIENPELFWESIAQNFQWSKDWDKTLEWDFKGPNIKWFKGGKLNITENCIDRHLENKGDQKAIIWEANDPQEESKSLSYNELHYEVCKMANVLKAHGIEKGDRVCFYMPMIFELAIAVLACARIGAIHSVVFAGFSAKALADRINDASCKMLITSDGINRGTKKIPAKDLADEALKECPSIETVLVKRCSNLEINMLEGRDFEIPEELAKVDNNCPAEPMDAEDPLFILYTSGSTGKPKGVVHSCGGYMVYTGYSFANVFQYEKSDIYWCTADIGWITGHSYIIYGPLLNGATTIMFEGIPSFPDPGRFWDIVDKHKVNQFYTAPTAIRALMACDDKFVEDKDLSSLKVIGSVGEPINEEAWHWYFEKIGKGNCSLVDTWWQTETGGIMISGLGKHSPMKPAHAGYPLPGIQTVLLDQSGNEILENGKEGYLAIKFPWPSIIRTTYGDHERCKKVYFSHYNGYYFTGDGARRDENGMYRVIGRVDDVINCSGHRLGTAEVEDAIDEHPDVIESAVVAFPHDIKGQGIFAFVICKEGVGHDDDLRVEILEVVTKHIGKIAKPDKILFVDGLPKTRSGKIMRRILRKIAEGDSSSLGDISTLLDPNVVEGIKAKALDLKG
tara:strand:- start:30035 stop:31942 length:1908 start_codon:yes stop_codon:yes gene_type:complete